MTVVGDLGCSGVDVDAWEKENRAPLFPNKVNRWILVRTLRDNPTPDDLKMTLAATFSKWFTGTPFDAAFPSDGTTRSANADLIRARTRLEGAPFVSTHRATSRAAARSAANAEAGRCRLARGELRLSRPTGRHAMAGSDRCAAPALYAAHDVPVDADWMLDSAAVPTVDAPPEKSSTDKANEALGGAAQRVGNTLFDALWLPLALVGAGLLVYLVGIRGIASAGRDSEAA